MIRFMPIGDQFAFKHTGANQFITLKFGQSIFDNWEDFERSYNYFREHVITDVNEYFPLEDFKKQMPKYMLPKKYDSYIASLRLSEKQMQNTKHCGLCHRDIPACMWVENVCDILPGGAFGAMTPHTCLSCGTPKDTEPKLKPSEDILNKVIERSPVSGYTSKEDLMNCNVLETIKQILNWLDNNFKGEK